MEIRTVVVAGTITAQGWLVREGPNGLATVFADGREITGRLIPRETSQNTQEEKAKCAP